MAFVEKPRRDSNKSPLAGKNNTPQLHHWKTAAGLP
jgi:hypothetical protein